MEASKRESARVYEELLESRDIILSRQLLIDELRQQIEAATRQPLRQDLEKVNRALADLSDKFAGAKGEAIIVQERLDEHRRSRPQEDQRLRTTCHGNPLSAAICVLILQTTTLGSYRETLGSCQHGGHVRNTESLPSPDRNSATTSATQRDRHACHARDLWHGEEGLLHGDYR